MRFFSDAVSGCKKRISKSEKGNGTAKCDTAGCTSGCKNISKLKKYKGVQTAALLYRFQAETADGKINIQVLGSEELPGTDRQKEDIEDTILLPEN